MSTNTVELEFWFFSDMKFSKDTVWWTEWHFLFFIGVFPGDFRVEFSVQICQGIVLSLSALSGSWHFSSDIFHSL